MYHNYLHIFIQEEMVFLDISSISVAYWYAAKIEKNVKQKKWDFGSENQKQGKGAPEQQNKGQIQCRASWDNPPKTQTIITPWSQRRTVRSGMSSITALLTTQVSVRPSSHWWPSWRFLNQMHAPTLHHNLERGMTKGSILSMRSPMPPFPPWISKRRNWNPKEEEHLFHYEMWINGSPL